MKALLALALLAAPGLAHAGPKVDLAFGNTIVSTYPDGRTGHLWLKDGGVYDYVGRNGKSSSGQWKIKGDDVCLKQTKPIAIPLNYCTPAPDGGVGITWGAKAISGENVVVQLLKGIVR